MMKILKASLCVVATLFFLMACTGCHMRSADDIFELQAIKKYIDAKNAQMKNNGTFGFQGNGIIRSDIGFGRAVIVDSTHWANTPGSNPIKYENVICLYRDNVLYAVNEIACAAFPDMPKAPENEINDITTFVNTESSTIQRMQADAAKM